MAEILFHGQHGVNAQRNEAVNLYRAGAVQGDANAMYNLGVLYLRVSFTFLFHVFGFFS